MKEVWSKSLSRLCVFRVTSDEDKTGLRMGSHFRDWREDGGWVSVRVLRVGNTEMSVWISTHCRSSQPTLPDESLVRTSFLPETIGG